MRYGANSITAALSESEVVWQLASILSPNPWGLSIVMIQANIAWTAGICWYRHSQRWTLPSKSGGSSGQAKPPAATHHQHLPQQ